MSAVSIEARIEVAAASDTGLQALLRATSGGVFRWYRNGLMRGNATPAVVTQLVSNVPMYSQDGRMKTSLARVQFTIFGGQHSAGAQAMEDVGQALAAFFATLNLTSTRSSSTVQPNFFEEYNKPYAQQDGVMYQKVMDLLVYVDEPS